MAVKKGASPQRVTELEKELAELKQRLGPLANLLNPAASPEPAAPTEPREVLSLKLDLDGKVIAQYENVGVCMANGCGKKVYACLSHPVRADHLLGGALAVFVPGGMNTAPSVYCQAHDPNQTHRNAVKALTPNGEIFGDNWEPRAPGTPIGL